MANQKIQFDFTVNGIPKTITDVDTLNNKVQNLDTSFQKAGASAQVGLGGKDIGTSLDLTNKKINDVQTNITQAGTTTEKFGAKLHDTTRGAQLAFSALGNGIQLFGGQSAQAIQGVISVLQILGELLKAQKAFTVASNISTEDGASLSQQLKGVNELTTGKKAAKVATTELATAEVTEAGAATAAAAGTSLLSKAMTFLGGPLGIILTSVSLLIAGYELLAGKTKEQIELDTEYGQQLLKLNDEIINRIKLENDLNQINIKVKIDALQTQLQIAQLYNDTLGEQETIEKRIASLKAASLQADIDALDLETQKLKTNSQLQRDIKKSLDEALVPKTAFGNPVNNANVDSSAQRELLVGIQDAALKLAPIDDKLLENDTKRKQLAADLKNLLENINQLIDKRYDKEKLLNDLEQKQLIFEQEISLLKISESKALDSADRNLSALKNQIAIGKNELEVFKNNIQGLIGGNFGSATQNILDLQTQNYKDAIEEQFVAFTKSELQKRVENAITNEQLIRSSLVTNQKLVLNSKAFTDAEKKNFSDFTNEFLTNDIVDSEGKLLDSVKEKLNKTFDLISGNKRLSEDLKTQFQNNLQIIVDSSQQLDKQNSFIPVQAFNEFEVAIDSLKNTMIQDLPFMAKSINQLYKEIVQPVGQTPGATIDDLNEKFQKFIDEVNIKIKNLREKLNGSELNIEIRLNPIFKLDEAKALEPLKNSINDINEAFNSQFNVDTAGQEKILDDIKHFNVLKLNEFLKERNAEISAAEETATLAIDKVNQARRKALSTVLADSSLSQNEKKIIIDDINTTADGAIATITKKVKTLKELFKGDLKDIVTNLYQIFSQITNQTLNLLSQIADLQNARADIEKQRLQDEIDDLQKQSDEKVKIIQDTNTRINELENQLHTARGNRHAYLLGLIAAEEHRREQAQAQEDALTARKEADAAKIAQLEKEQIKRNLELAKVQAIAQGALAVIAALASAPPPFNIIEAALIGAEVFVNIAKINEQIDALGKDGGLLTVGANGGMVQGPSHAQGGVRGTGSFNNVEVEGNEFLVNKQSTSLNAGILNTINTAGRNQQFALAPINRREMGGNIPFDSINSSIRSSSIDMASFSKQIEKAVNEGLSKADISVAVTEINDKQKTVAKIIEGSKV